jgi:hypothetical protein
MEWFKVWDGDLIFLWQIWSNTMINIAANKPAVSLRNFLQKTILLMTGSTVVNQNNAAQLDTPSTTKPDLTTKQSHPSGYHETEHIRNYYKTAGL